MLITDANVMKDEKRVDLFEAHEELAQAPFVESADDHGAPSTHSLSAFAQGSTGICRLWLARDLRLGVAGT